ncbi:MAG: bifunctional riboflavin kinase/FAD synthetase [Bacteroidia bacterium]
MKIYHSLPEFQSVANAVVTIGTFDGVHVGHQKIIARLKEIASRQQGEVVVLTFFPHPRMVLFPDSDIKLINTIAEKQLLLERFGADHLIIHPFTKEFSRYSAIEFVRDILVNRIGTKTLVIGYDHHFGRNREGSLEELKELAPLYNFEVEEIPEQDIDDVAVSSTKIRKALMEGDISTANKYLGYNYMLSGNVVSGDKIGRSLGFPTANLRIEDKLKLIPADGVYAVHIIINETKWNGMLYIGNRPTMQGKTKNIEVNIFDFDKDIYNESITVELLEKIRPDQTFLNMEELGKQLIEDREQAINILGKP